MPEEGDVGCHIGRHMEGAPRELRESGDPLASTVKEGWVKVGSTSKSSEGISLCDWMSLGHSREGTKGGLWQGPALSHWCAWHLGGLFMPYL